MQRRISYLLAGVFVALSFMVNAQTKTSPLTASAFYELISRNESLQLIDVRTPEEFASGHIKGAVNISLYDKDFAGLVAQLKKNEPVFVYCKGGGRSREAAGKMEELGFTDIHDLRGGITAWKKNKLPIQESGADNKPGVISPAGFSRFLSENERVLVDFYAPWCGPCKAMEPALRRLTKQFAGKVTVLRVNVDESPQLVARLGLRSIPVLATYKKGAPLNMAEGWQSEKKLRKLFEQLL